MRGFRSIGPEAFGPGPQDAPEQAALPPDRPANRESLGVLLVYPVRANGRTDGHHAGSVWNHRRFPALRNRRSTPSGAAACSGHTDRGAKVTNIRHFCSTRSCRAHLWPLCAYRARRRPVHQAPYGRPRSRRTREMITDLSRKNGREYRLLAHGIPTSRAKRGR
jgi:hypothetical protein